MFKTKLVIFIITPVIGFLSVLINVFSINNFLHIFYNNIFFDTMSMTLIVTTLLTLVICLTVVDNKYKFKSYTFFFLFWSFLISITALVMSKNIISFFIFYELLLIPSFVLVKESSPNRRSNIVANYFLLWTQFGSFLVLVGLFLHFNKNFNFMFFNFFDIKQIPLSQILIFFGFGVKVPLWPFHFWLSKTHVEANTGFSIFLSGILVKAAVFGLYKFAFLFDNNFLWLPLTIVFISIIDASIKMCIQIDLKKLVAFSTIQEMGFMTLLIILPSHFNYQILFVFVVFHTFISALFFWIVDCIYRRYGSRILYNISGVINLFPNLGSIIIVATYLFIGLPFTIKFSIEFFLLKNLLNFNIIILILLCFFVNFLSVVFFFKTFVFLNFGSIPKITGNDLTKKELLVSLLIITGIILLNLI